MWIQASHEKEWYVKLWTIAKCKGITLQRALTATAVATALSATWAQAQDSIDIPSDVLKEVQVIKEKPAGTLMNVGTFSGRFMLEKMPNGNVNVYSGNKLLYTIGNIEDIQEDTYVPDNRPIWTEFDFKKQEVSWGGDFRQNRSGTGIEWKISSSTLVSANIGRYGKSVTADLWIGSELTKNTAIAINAEVGPNLQRLLGTLWFGFENGVLMFSGEHLWVKNKFQFSSGEVEQMVRQNSAGTTLKLYFTESMVKSLELSGYITKAQSYELANKEYTVSNETVFAIYDNFRNIAGWEKKWVQAKLNFDVSKNGKLTLWLNYESLHHDTKYSAQKTRTQLWGVIGYSHNFWSGMEGNINLRTGVASTDIELGLSKNLEGGSRVWVVVRHTQWNNGTLNDTYVWVQYTIPLWEKAQSKVKSDTPSANLNKPNTGLYQSTKASRIVSDVISQNRSFRHGNTIHIVDQKSVKILEIDKTKVPDSLEIINDQWEMRLDYKISSVNRIMKNGWVFSNVWEFQLVWDSFIIKPRNFQQPARGTIDTYNINLSKVQGGQINVTLEVKPGSVIISNVIVEDVWGIDKTNLNIIISQAQWKKEQDYTPNSWKKFMEALQQAIATRDSTTATQKDVDQAGGILELSIKELKQRADFSLLTSKIQEAQNIYNAGAWKYTHESLVNLKQAIILSQTTLWNLNSSQEEVNNALWVLEWAIKGLQEIQAVLPTSGFASGSVTKLTTDASFTNTFSTNSPWAVTYSSSNTAVATVNPSTWAVTIVWAWSATITANQAAAPWFTADSDSYSLTVNTVVVGPVLPTSSFASGSVTKLTTDASFTNTFSTNSPWAVTYTSSNTAVATVNPSTWAVTIVWAWSATITANQAAAPWFTADSDTYTLTVNAAAVLPTSSFASGSVTKLTTDVSFTNTFSTNSPWAVTYSSSNTAVATVNPSTWAVTIVWAWSATITANQAAAPWFTADSDTYTLTVNAAVDNELPVLSSITVNGGQEFTRNASVSVSVSGSDNVWITGYYAQVVYGYDTPAPSAPSAWAAGWVSSLSNVTLSNQWVNRVYVWAKDAQGNVSNSVVDGLFFDNVAPTAGYTVNQPVANGPVTIRVTLSWIWSWWTDQTQSTPWDAPSWWTDAGWGIYERTVSSTASVSYTFSDDAGNTVSVTPDLSGYTIDTTPPTASSTLPISVSPSGNISWTITFSEPVLVEVLAGWAVFWVSDQWTLVNSVSVNTTAPTETGSITLQLRLTDAAWLENTVSYTVTVSGLPD